MRRDRWVKSLLKLPQSLSVLDSMPFLAALCKSELVKARRAGDDARAADLSQAKEYIKAHFKEKVAYHRCVNGCGRAVAKIGIRCQLCYRQRRYGRKLEANAV